MYRFTRYEYSNVNGKENVTVETSDNPPAGYRSGRISALPDGFNHLGDNYVREYRSVTRNGDTQTRIYNSNNRPASRTKTNIITNEDIDIDDFDNKFERLFNKRSVFWENDTDMTDDKFAGFSNNFGSSRSPSASRGPVKTAINDEIKNTIRDASMKHHNHYRGLHHDTRPVEWDDSLAKGAHEWAEILGTNKTFRHSNKANLGENLYMFSTSEDMDFDKVCQHAVQSWYSEIKNYDLQTHWQTGTVGHFTQVVWKDTRKIGVGVCKIRENGMTSIYVVGRYSPPGNFVGKYKDNVKPLK